MYDVFFSDTAKKQYKKLGREQQERIISAIERIRIRPEAHVTKLVGDPGYKLRVGDHRILMDIEKDKLLILVLKIGHRKNIYK
ncbi:MAG: type II toxin-antitoxin system RelE/ParE family toxin [Candidatus Altiarchaeota archaeon]|nr:type II toxin-antitoxin system RelE/ParE family toxin [Candidatus Altiarchaeota archaeon]